MTDACHACRRLVDRHPKAARRAAFLLLLALFFTVLGMVSEPVFLPGMCKVYP